MVDSKKVVIAGGGSGGHLFPGLSIADALIEQGMSKSNIIFFGSKYTLERWLVPEAGYKIFLFSGRGINRIKSPKYLLKNIMNVLGLLAAFFKAIFLMFKIKPAVVIGVGGFASFPAIVSAFILRKKIIVHEQNSVLGRINSFAQRLGATVVTTFSDVQGAKDPILLGLPLRREVLSQLKLARHSQEQSSPSRNLEQRSNEESSKKKITIFGGSLGARIINTAVIDLLKTHDISNDWDITLITGPKNLDEVKKEISVSHPELKVLPFVNNLFEIILDSDLVVSRAGAGTCVELEVANVFSVLIPLAIAPGNHQEKNALDVVNLGKAIVLKERDLNGQSLFIAISEGLKKPTTPHEGAESIHLTANIRIAKYIVENYLV